MLKYKVQNVSREIQPCENLTNLQFLLNYHSPKKYSIGENGSNNRIVYLIYNILLDWLTSHGTLFKKRCKIDGIIPPEHGDLDV